MKRIFYTILAATIALGSCQKENHIAPVAGDQSLSITDADFVASKATIGSNKKNNEGGLDLDYDIVLKEVSKDKYRLKIKLKAMRVAGYEFGNSKLINGVVWGVVTKLTNNDDKAPLNITLTSAEKNGDTYLFPDFEYKGDLDFELLDISSRFRIKGGDLLIKDASTISFLSSDITVDNGNFKPGNSFEIKEGTTVTVNQQKTETSFAILFNAAEDECSFVSNGSYFILPKGHSVEQDPKVAKVTFPKSEDGSKVMRITVKGDPAESVASVYYTPAPIPDPNNPGSTIQPPAIEFHKSEPSDKKIGICCYDRCLEPKNNYICGTTIHLKPADFNANGPGWARITLKYEL